MFLAVSLVFGKICKICSTGWYVHTFSVLHGFWCLMETWVARVLDCNSDTNWLPCPVEMLGWLSFICILHYYVLNKLKTQILYRCFWGLLYVTILKIYISNYGYLFGTAMYVDYLMFSHLNPISNPAPLPNATLTIGATACNPNYRGSRVYPNYRGSRTQP